MTRFPLIPRTAGLSYIWKMVTMSVTVLFRAIVPPPRASFRATTEYINSSELSIGRILFDF